MKKTILFSILILVIMEGISWWAYKVFFSRSEGVPTKSFQGEALSPPVNSRGPSEERVQSSEENNQKKETPSVSAGNTSGPEGSFPAPQTEVVNGVTERTIHMGVRQFEWDPKVIHAKQGELVRLVIHNADVKHGLAIPGLGVNEDISEDGAVVTFKATKKGTFDFLCSVYCGTGHAEMQGTLIVE